MNILIRLIVAHIIADFFLQTDAIASGKQSSSQSQLFYLFIHSAINAALAYLFVAQWELWQIPLVVFITHFMIDYTKTRFSQESVVVFIVDQVFHLAILGALWCWLFAGASELSTLLYIKEQLFSPKLWLILTSYLLVLKPTSILLGLFISQWTPKNNEQQSLPNAGKWIGYLERVLILTMMYLGCLEGIGFLLAAKSIFRFGELTKPREVKITEYVMIGTLSSFAIAIIIGALILAGKLIQF